jgi:hypothetical protein
MAARCAPAELNGLGAVRFVWQADLTSAVGTSGLPDNLSGAGVQQRGEIRGSGAFGCREVISTIDSAEALERP